MTQFLHAHGELIILGFVTLMLLLTVGVLARFHVAINVEKVAALVELANTKGGIILLLWFTSMAFFLAGMRLIYWSVNMMIDGKISADNALVVACFSWVSGSAFGGTIGAMIKTMTGETVVAKSNGPGVSPAPGPQVPITMPLPAPAPAPVPAVAVPIESTQEERFGSK